ncbi:transcriptional regulator [Mycolicibacterium chitae]|uniref:Putative transcriptional regulator n=2 Tax=Mycobacteriaceae TaxID=1762 RepID=A0A3S4RUW2_MYCCI|nr:transcriptional regulator [Mycolicibacterium chitae]VEG49418.1 putative transcriptional regulator [Mycolicibacterium chitae]
MSGMATRRSYGQFCGLAHALDVVGERWTLLIVRELAIGPKRYTELADALTGIGTSLLATRMRQLEADGVIERRLALDKPGSSVVYDLSEAGRELARAVIPLAMWGARHQMADVEFDEELFRAEWLLAFLAADVRNDLPEGLDAVYEFRIGASVAALHLHAGGTRVTPGPTETPADATIAAAPETVAALVGGRLELGEALTQGLLQADGDSAAVAALVGVIEKRLRALVPA